MQAKLMPFVPLAHQKKVSKSGITSLNSEHPALTPIIKHADEKALMMDYPGVPLPPMPNHHAL
jgi:hypothetical protein